MKRHKTVFAGLLLAFGVLTGPAQAGPMLELIENGEFENFSSTSNWKRSGWLKANSVPGWLGATEGHIEIWRQGAMNSPALGSDGNPTGFHAELTGDSQTSIVQTTFLTPEWLAPQSQALLSFDIWNRRGNGVFVSLEPLFQPKLRLEPGACEQEESSLACETSDDPINGDLLSIPQATQFAAEPVTDGRWIRHEQWVDLMPSTQYTLNFRGLGGGTSGSHIDQVSLGISSARSPAARVPVPAPLALMAVGLLALGLGRRGRRGA